jgi:two-component system sensor histidine kinase YesM
MDQRARNNTAGGIKLLHRPQNRKLTLWLPKLSLKRKITMFVAVLLFMAIFTIGLCSYYIAANQVVNKVTQSQMALVRQVANNLDQLLSDAEDISSLINTDTGMQRILQIPNVQRYRLKYPTPEPFGYLNTIMAVKSYITMITVYGFNGLTYSVGTDVGDSNVVPFSEFKKNPIFKKAKQLNGGIGIEYFNNTPPIMSDYRVPRIVLYRVMKELELSNFYNLGVLLIWLNEKNIRSIYRMNVPTGGSIFIIDQQGNIISGSDSFGDYRPLLSYFSDGALRNKDSSSEIIHFKQNKMMLTYSTSTISGWKVVALTPTAILTQNIKSIALVMIMVCGACYILLLFFSGYITNIITNPLGQLLTSIKKVQTGDLTQQVNFTGEDEIGELGQGYNAMVAHIKDLIERVYKLQIREREAELNALQAQINPHFLYNTLDTIFWKAEKNHMPEIGEMVYALSRIFRLSLNRGNELTTVAQEKELIEYYLVLQQIRFQDKLTYQLEFDEEILELTIPKLVLQPFVENAIIHGIEGLETSGHIRITGKLINGQITFQIIDNGVGMTKEKVEQILSAGHHLETNPTTVSGGYAIRNVLERLELYYQSNYQLIFDSLPGQGTTVVIIVPQYCRWEKDHD